MGILHALTQQLNQLPVRITLLFSAIFLCVALFTSSIVFGYLQSNIVLIREEYGRKLLAMGAEDALTVAQVASVEPLLERYATALAAEFHTVDSAVYDATGNLVAAASPALWPATVPSTAEERVEPSPVDPNTLLEQTADNALRLYQPIQLDAQTGGWQAIRLDLSSERNLTDGLYGRFLTGLLATLALIVASGVYLRSYTRRNLQPLLNLTHKIGQINWDAELSTRVNGEFRELGDGIAEMKANLANYEAQRKTLLDRISHDILSPLGYISITASAYQNPKTFDEQEWYIVYICSQQVTRLLEDLKYLMNGRIDTLPPSPDNSIAVAPVIEQLLIYYRMNAGSAIEYRFEPTPDSEPLCTPMETTRLMQILGNLLDNARTHGRATNVTVTVQQQAGRMVEIRVEDNGVGIAPAHLPRIFQERFSTAKGKGPNQGLGLAIVHDIITRHQGKIAVESTVGEGTTFTILLPLGNCVPAVGELPTMA